MNPHRSLRRLMASSSNYSAPPRIRPRLTPPEGLSAFVDAHPLCKEEDILTTHVFSRLSLTDHMVVEQTCKKWMLWSRRARQAQLDDLLFRQRQILQQWILEDIIYNDGRDFMVWLRANMAIRFDVFDDNVYL